MSQGLIPRRYAKALLYTANEKHVATEVYNAFKSLDYELTHNPELNKALSNPFIKPSDKTNLIEAACGTSNGPEASTKMIIAEFVALLIKNKRINQIKYISRNLIELYRESNKICPVVVESTFNLPVDLLSRIKDIVKARIKDFTPEYVFNTNPKLIGGFTIQIGNDKLDASIINELNQLRLNLIKN